MGPDGGRRAVGPDPLPQFPTSAAHRPLPTKMLKRLPLLIAAAALAIWPGNFIVKNFLAVSLIAYDETRASRDLAAAYAPGNPLVAAARGKFLLYRAEPALPREAIGELRRAVTASPRDYRFWLELGRAYENTGDAGSAGTAYERAVELAPRYFDARWAFANFHLRTGQNERALNDFRKAIALSGRDPTLPDRKATLNIYNAIAGTLGANLDAMRRVASPSAAAEAYLVDFFAAADSPNASPDTALELWRQLRRSDSEPYRKACFSLLRVLQTIGRFAGAREVWDGIESFAGAGEAGRDNLMVNAGFERTPLSERFEELAGSQTGFDWIVMRHGEVRARRTGFEKHGGAHSLHITIAASMRSEFQEVWQIAAVEPLQSYRLSYFVKTKNVPSDAPFIEITDAANPGGFALRSVAPSGTANWRQQAIAFTIPVDTAGLRLTVRIPRLSPADLSQIAEIWFDDFTLEKVPQ
jgi:hypothetical protein